MTDSKQDVDALIAKLSDKSSPKRRSAAKGLRKIGSPQACAALLEALNLELHDKRTWETQYHLIMALAESRCESALPLIRRLAESRFWATMRQVAVGDAFVRLSNPSSLNATPIFDAIEIARDHDVEVAEGAMRAVAMLRLKFDEGTASHLIDKVDRLGNEGVNFWTAGSCPGWTGDNVRAFLERYAQSSEKGTREVAELALKGTYKIYKPL
jgi:HEAT repeat protein